MKVTTNSYTLPIIEQRWLFVKSCDTSQADLQTYVSYFLPFDFSPSLLLRVPFTEGFDGAAWVAASVSMCGQIRARVDSLPDLSQSLSWGRSHVASSSHAVASAALLSTWAVVEALGEASRANDNVGRPLESTVDTTPSRTVSAIA